MKLMDNIAGLLRKIRFARRRIWVGYGLYRSLHQSFENQASASNLRLDRLTSDVNANFGKLMNDVTDIKDELERRAANASTVVDLLLDELRSRHLSENESANVLDCVLRDVVQKQHHSMFWGDRMLTLDKSAAFRHDETFQAALAETSSSTGSNQYESPDGISWRYNTLIWAARSCLSVPGDFVECGVFRGDMTWMVTRNVDLKGHGKKFFLYDTFSGFDERYSSESDFSYAPHSFHATNREYQMPGIENDVRRRFGNDDYVVVTKGIVPDVLHEVAPARIAFLHLDMNSPRAEAGALEVLFERISPNGIIVFDDYGWKLYAPQKAAADAFMAARGQSIMEMPTGQGLLIKRC